MWTAEQTRQYVAKVACVPADDLQRLFLPGKSESTYCFLQDDADTTHSAHFRDGRAEPLVVMSSLYEPDGGPQSGWSSSPSVIWARSLPSAFTV